MLSPPVAAAPWRSSVLLLALPAAGLASPYPRVAHNPADRMAGHADRRLPLRPGHALREAAGRGRHGDDRLARAPRRAAMSWGTNRCERLGDGYSLHAEGRAIDWHLDVRVPADRRAARRLIGLLLATDRAATRTRWPGAWASRRSSGTAARGGRARSGWAATRCASTAAGRPRKRVDCTQAHRDHVHIGLSRAGARKRTSFWRSRR